MEIATIVAGAIALMGRVVTYLILGRVILSWFHLSPSNILYRFFYGVTEPLLSPVRSLVGRFTKGPMLLDFSPIITWMLLDYIIIPALIRLVYFIFK